MNNHVRSMSSQTCRPSEAITVQPCHILIAVLVYCAIRLGKSAKIITACLWPTLQLHMSCWQNLRLCSLGLAIKQLRYGLRISEFNIVVIVSQCELNADQTDRYSALDRQ